MSRGARGAETDRCQFIAAVIGRRSGRRNLDNIHHVSLYEEGFILVQLNKPQKVLIVAVSLVTVKKSEEAVRAYLKLQ